LTVLEHGASQGGGLRPYLHALDLKDFLLLGLGGHMPYPSGREALGRYQLLYRRVWHNDLAL
jgi:hypothetical protein